MVVVIRCSGRGARLAAGASQPAPRQKAFVPNRAAVFAGSVRVRAAPEKGSVPWEMGGIYYARRGKEKNSGCSKEDA